MRFITATKTFDGEKFLSEGYVLVIDESGTLLNIVKENEAAGKTIERYEGIISPGFINAHCHLELSHMKDVIGEKTGLIDFAKGIITKRNSFSDEQIKTAGEKWDAKMFENGIIAVGDICNGASTFATKKQSKILYHSFIELIGLDPAVSDHILNKGKELSGEAEKLGLRYSLAPHAPYSVSFELMKKISEFNLKHISISSIHNQESADENKFFFGERGGFHDLYQFLKMDISYFHPTGKNSLPSYLSFLSENEKLILVHNTFSDEEDVEFAESLHKELYWCLCPSANLYIENVLPDVKLLQKKNVNVCLGTDSLASNHTLSVVDEMNTLLQNFSDLEPETILKWATKGGAEALDITDTFGSFTKGKRPGINLLNYENRQFSFSQKLA